jgi:hypothetical protein
MKIDMLVIFLLYVRTAKRILTADHGPFSALKFGKSSHLPSSYHLPFDLPFRY